MILPEEIIIISSIYLETSASASGTVANLKNGQRRAISFMINHAT